MKPRVVKADVETVAGKPQKEARVEMYEWGIGGWEFISAYDSIARARSAANECGGPACVVTFTLE